MAQTSPEPMGLEVHRAEGIYLYGPEGRQWMDLISGIAVSNVGHCAPEVVEAVQRQAAQFMHVMVYGEYLLAPQVQFAELLLAQLDESLDSVFFVNSGTEAVEGALKLAKKSTGRTEMLGFRHSYHGGTHGAMSVTGAAWIKEGYGPFLPEIFHLEFNNFSHLSLITEKTACVIVEPVQGEAGVRLPREGFLEALRKRCDETGALLIFDEIQTGFGRTGRLFAHQKFGVLPDVLLCAKAMGGGMPIGAFIAGKERMASLQNEPILGHITTFGGHPVSCAAAHAALKKLLDEQLIPAVEAKEKLVRDRLVHPLIKGIHGTGLMLAIDLGDFALVEGTMKKGFEKGFIVDWFLENTERVRFAPPLIISEAELGRACQLILEVLDELMAERKA